MGKTLKRVFIRIYQRDWLLVLLILLCSLIVRAYFLHLPGPNPDELLYAFPAESLKVGDPVWAKTFQIAGRPLPAGLDGYQGAFPIYIHWLVSQFTNYYLRFRVINILYGLAMIGFTYYFTRAFISKRAAVISALFLATLPSMVFFSRIGEIAIFLRVMLASAALYCFYEWWSDKLNWAAFYAGCLSLGIGVSTRLEIMWWVVACFAYFILLNRFQLRQILAVLLSHQGKTLIGIVCFLLGSSLFITYNILTRVGTITQIMQNLISTQAGHPNFVLFTNLSKRIIHLILLLDGGEIWGASEVFQNSLFSIAFGISFLSLSAITVASRFKRKPEHKSEFLLFMLAFMLFESTFSVSTINVMHILLFMPIPILILVKFLDLISYRFATVLIVLVLITGNLSVDARYYNSLLRDGGRGIYSPRIYSFVAELQQLGIAKVVACDWGLARMVYYFSHGCVKVEEIFDYSNDVPTSFFYDGLKAALEEKNNSFLFYAPSYTGFRRQEAFLAYLRERGLAYKEHIFCDNYGPIYFLYTMEDQR
jgi:hypothetical protein